MRPRRLLSMRTLDLLVLLSFGFSLIWFNQGEIFTSVPLQYPPMVYLCLRLAWIAASRARAARRPRAAPAEPAAPARRRPAFGGSAPTWLLVSLLAVALALRFGLNAFDSNVIDVGYAGVIGADRITHGETPYGTFPSDCATCDTYGPLNYIAYVPFELTQPWHGSWDSLPAAHGAATLFDLLCIGGLAMLGWQLSGLRLGIGLALAWAAFPFTAYALESNSNDSLVAAMLIWGLVAARHPLGRGLLLGLALATKFAPADPDTALEPPAVSARGLVAPADPVRSGTRPVGGPDGLGAPARRPRRRPGVLVAHGGLPVRPRLPLLPLGAVSGAASDPDRPDGGRGPRRARGAALAATARPPDDERAVGRPADRPRADRDPLVLPLHPLVPAVRPGGDGARLAAPGAGCRPGARPGARAAARAPAGGRDDERAGAALPGRRPGRVRVAGAAPARLLRRRGHHRHPHLPRGLRPHRRRGHPLSATSRWSTRRSPPGSSGSPGCCRGSTRGRSPA